MQWPQLTHLFPHPSPHPSPHLSLQGPHTTENPRLPLLRRQESTTTAAIITGTTPGRSGTPTGQTSIQPAHHTRRGGPAGGGQVPQCSGRPGGAHHHGHDGIWTASPFRVPPRSSLRRTSPSPLPPPLL